MTGVQTCALPISEDVIAHHGVIEEGTAFLQKPFTGASLTRKVREVLDR